MYARVFRAGRKVRTRVQKGRRESFVLEWSSFGTPKQKVLRISILENARESAFFRDRPFHGSLHGEIFRMYLPARALRIRVQFVVYALVRLAANANNA